MLLVKFKASHGAYRGGETAGFTAEEAAHLVEKLDVADYCEEVRFKKAHGSFKPGDRAFVNGEEADNLIEAKVAERPKGKDKAEGTSSASSSAAQGGSGAGSQGGSAS